MDSVVCVCVLVCVSVLEDVEGRKVILKMMEIQYSCMIISNIFNKKENGIHYYIFTLEYHDTLLIFPLL